MNNRIEQNNLLKLIKDVEKRVNKLEEIINYPKNISDKDELFDEAVRTVKKYERVSASLLQRRLMIGYARAARILDELEEAGYIGPGIGSKPRKVLSINI